MFIQILQVRTVRQINLSKAKTRCKALVGQPAPTLLWTYAKACNAYADDLFRLACCAGEWKGRERQAKDLPFREFQR